jgi:hypothetical protein
MESPIWAEHDRLRPGVGGVCEGKTPRGGNQFKVREFLHNRQLPHTSTHPLRHGLALFISPARPPNPDESSTRKPFGKPGPVGLPEPIPCRPAGDRRLSRVYHDCSSSPRELHTTESPAFVTSWATQSQSPAQQSSHSKPPSFSPPPSAQTLCVPSQRNWKRTNRRSWKRIEKIWR